MFLKVYPLTRRRLFKKVLFSSSKIEDVGIFTLIVIDLHLASKDIAKDVSSAGWFEIFLTKDQTDKVRNECLSHIDKVDDAFGETNRRKTPAPVDVTNKGGPTNPEDEKVWRAPMASGLKSHMPGSALCSL